MIVCETKRELRSAVAELRSRRRGKLGFVPTMGALHDGHLELVRRARADTGIVVASVFVNPTQFGPNEDLSSYPRDPEGDRALLKAAGVDLVFLPSVDEVYPKGCETTVDTVKLSRMLVGRLRPGHFRGVATVVTKLFNMVQPDRAYFGEKDYQQLQVIRRMVADLDMPVEIVGVPTVREEDGLAMSSRNVRLDPEDRAAAAVLNHSLDAAEARFSEGLVSSRALKRLVRSILESEIRANVQSVDIRDAASLGEIRGDIERPAVILLAVRFGSVLLIDQRVIADRAVMWSKAAE
ncbi:MAG: pantoate--beta-alanine ligase [Pseudomonadota bacterium]